MAMRKDEISFGGDSMKIIHNSGSIQAAAENENRDASLAQLASMVDFLCILADVPTEDETINTEEGMSNE